MPHAASRGCPGAASAVEPGPGRARLPRPPARPRLARRGRGRAGLLIPRCASVHTFGMRFELDLVFLDGDGRPLPIRRAVPPRRLVSAPRRAVLELPAAIRGSEPRRGGEFAVAGA